MILQYHNRHNPKYVNNTKMYTIIETDDPKYVNHTNTDTIRKTISLTVLIANADLISTFDTA